jgi:hypothetical protein
MRTKAAVLTALTGLLLATTAGCLGPLYKSETQYDRGKWFGLAGPDQVARTKQDKLALAKLAAAPAQTLVTNGVPQGYLGVIANMSAYRRLLFKYSGPETGAEYLGPGQQVEKYLLPGAYAGEIFYGGDKVGWTTFTSEPVEKTYLGKKVHWFFFSEW